MQRPVVRGSRIRGGHPNDGLSRHTEHQRSKSFSAASDCYSAAPAPSRSQSVPSGLISRLGIYLLQYKQHTVVTARLDTRRTATVPSRLQESKQRAQGETGRRRCGMHSGMAWPGLIGGRRLACLSQNHGQRHYLDIQQLTQGGHCQ